MMMTKKFDPKEHFEMVWNLLDNGEKLTKDPKERAASLFYLGIYTFILHMEQEDAEID